MLNTLVVPAGVDFTSGWNALWSAVSSTLGTGFTVGMSIFGVALIIMAVGKFAWDKRKGGGGLGGGGGGLSPIGWALFIGTMLCAPSLIIPSILKIAEVVANFFIAIFGKIGG